MECHQWKHRFFGVENYSDNIAVTVNVFITLKPYSCLLGSISTFLESQPKCNHYCRVARNWLLIWKIFSQLILTYQCFLNFSSRIINVIIFSFFFFFEYDNQLVDLVQSFSSHGWLRRGPGQHIKFEYSVAWNVLKFLQRLFKRYNTVHILKYCMQNYSHERSS